MRTMWSSYGPSRISTIKMESRTRENRVRASCTRRVSGEQQVDVSLSAWLHAAGGLRFEGLAEFGLSRLGDFRQELVGLATAKSPFLGEWRPSGRQFWLRPTVSIEIRALPRRPGRLLGHATILRSLPQILEHPPKELAPD
jgi:hypothetical protein